MFASLRSFCVLAALSTFALATPTPLFKRQCAATLNTAKGVATELQNKWYLPNTGAYNSGPYELWTDANALEDVHNLMLAAGVDTWGTLADTSYLGGLAKNAGTDWAGILNGSNDDAQWVILTLWKMADYKAAKGQDNSAWMNAAATIYKMIEAQWDESVCGGGVWWSTAHTYKNAITNQLFLTTSAQGYLRTKDQSYLDNAKKTWDWLSKSGMRNADGLFNDGLDSSTCKNNGQTTWTYNQGVVASGLAALAKATGDSSLLDQAEITLDAAVKHLTSGGVLKEACDDASGASKCNADQQTFKGIWTKHVQYYLDNANDAARTAKYAPVLGAQAGAVAKNGIAASASSDVGSVWFGANAGGSQFSMQSQTSGLAALNADAKYGPC